MFIIMSFIYAKLLVVICIAYVLSEVVTHNVPLHYYEGFFTYLYGASILFLLYVFCYLLHDNSTGAPPPPPKPPKQSKAAKKAQKKQEKQEKEAAKKQKKSKKDASQPPPQPPPMPADEATGAPAGKGGKSGAMFQILK
ncbi:hypothetical protein J437_LFUL013156 [Ladona fulva]|uniref:Uncharacterized protein n=1 Tax=Ladona fulva TaxID=123851 RepID=A0A8K0KII0_LADFU|nr:hypothetical protein J437_LFUL013156 [Ladona fulva]